MEKAEKKEFLNELENQLDILVRVEKERDLKIDEIREKLRIIKQIMLNSSNFEDLRNLRKILHQDWLKNHIRHNFDELPVMPLDLDKLIKLIE